MKTLFIITALFFCYSTSYSQQSEVIEQDAKFIISDARFNKADVTQAVLDQGAIMVLYHFKGSEDHYFANILTKQKSQSYGKIFNLVTTKAAATPTEFKNETIAFKWSYVNDYDKKEGTANVKIGIVYKPAGAAFVITVITEDLDTLLYRGYVSGSLTN